MQLKLIHKLKEYPYTETHSKEALWASIKIEVWDANNEPVLTVLDIEWDIFVFLSWCIENKYYLLNEKIPKYIQFDSSIAKSLFNFYQDDSIDSEAFSVFSIVYDYRTRHGLRFAFRGTDIDDVYLGQVDNVVFISCYDDDKAYNYPVDLEKFITEIQELYHSLLLQAR